MTFQDLGLNVELTRAVEALGFETLTQVQEEAIPVLRSGRDLIAQSQTGTGKTLAFAIPALEKIEPRNMVQALILCPTRELAQQCCQEIKKLTRFMRELWPVDVYGGASMDRQIALLKRSNLVVGTPGRVMDHMRRGTLSLKDVKLVILDEADEMLSMGFREDIETILKDIPAERQIGLFSATMPELIRALTDEFMREPVMVRIHAEQVTLEEIKQSYIEVPLARKLDALHLILHAYQPKRCMLFVNTKLMADEAQLFLNQHGWASEAIHGDMNQSQRTRVMEGFRSARIPILVATDVAARGIDVQNVDYVINFDIPKNGEIYVHRIGRTGRAGKTGRAITLISGKRQRMELYEIERFTRSKIQPSPLPTVADIRRIIEKINRNAIREAIERGGSGEHAELIEALLAEGFSLEALAEATLELAFSKVEDELQDIPIPKREPPRDRMGERRLTLNVGRKNGVTAKHIVASIADHAKVSGSVVGKIEIYADRTIVGLPREQAMQVLSAMRGVQLCGVRLSPALMPDRSAAPDKLPHPKQAKGRDKARLLDGSDLSKHSIDRARKQEKRHRRG